MGESILKTRVSNKGIAGRLLAKVYVKFDLLGIGLY